MKGIKIGSNLLLACVANLYLVAAFAQQVGNPLLPVGFIGENKPSTFYVVDIAVDSQGDIYALDPFHRTASRYAENGELLQQVAAPVFVGGARGITVDSQGRIYVSDPQITGNIHIYSAKGELVDVWTGFRGVGSMDVDSNDRIYIALGEDRTGTNAIAVYDTGGNEIMRFGEPGSGPGQLNLPADVAVAPDGSIYVADTWNFRVQKYDAQGNYLLTIGTGEATELLEGFKKPVSVSVDSSGNVFVSDRRNYRVQKFDSNGNFITAWGMKGNDAGQFIEHQGLAVAPDDTVWVAGYHGHDIQHFDNDGNLLERWQGELSGPGEFSDATGVTIVDDKLFAADRWNQRIQVFNAFTGDYLYDFGERGQGLEAFNFPRTITSDVNGDLYVSGDDFVRRLKQDGTFIVRYPRPIGARHRSFGLAVSTDLSLFQASTGNSAVVVYDAMTTDIINRWGGLGVGPRMFGKNSPNGVALGPDGSLYVADTTNKRIQRFSENGAFISQWGKVTGDTRIGKPFALASDFDRGFLYVGDGNRMLAYDFEGNFKFEWGQFGQDLGEFDRIFGITVGSDGSVYVAERNNARIQKFVEPLKIVPTGKPSYGIGESLGYFVWQDEDDGEWHLRWSSDGAQHNYKATLVSHNGGFAKVSPFSFESNDQINVTSTRLDIEAIVSVGEDGVDFFVSPGAAVGFYLRIDDASDGGHVSIGSESASPTKSPFYLLSDSLSQISNIPSSGEPIYEAGQNTAYYLWQNEIDGGWHLRWSSDRWQRHFSGTISATAPLTDVSAVSFEQNDEYAVDDFLLTFSSLASVWQDGIDFRLPPGATANFRLSIGSQPVMEQVLIGGGMESPNSFPFVLTAE